MRIPTVLHGCSTISCCNKFRIYKQKILDDIKYDSLLFTSDVIALTETQLLPSESDDEIIRTLSLSPFRLYRQDHVTDKYSSMAVCTKGSVEIKICEYFHHLMP